MWYIITFIAGGVCEAVAAYFVKKYKAKIAAKEAALVTGVKKAI